MREDWRDRDDEDGEEEADPDGAAGGLADDVADDLDDDPELEAEFPAGDGTADVEGVVWCPYCGEPNEVSLDPGGGSMQEYVEDCQVCCRPWRVTVRYRGDGSAEVRTDSLDGSADW